LDFLSFAIEPEVDWEETAMKRLIAAVPLIALSAAANASIAYGSLGNFDTVNDTGQVCYGFEIELDDIHSANITYTYDYNHYGTPKIREDNTDPAHPKVFVRYESGKDAAGKFLHFTAIPTGTIAPTDGHQCTNPAVNFGCEHFGVGYYNSPTAVKYNWLVDDGAGNLIHGPAVNVSMPVFTYIPPVAQQPAQVQAVIPAPEPAEVHVKEFGDAVWIKSIVTVTHNNNPIPLRDLVADDPNEVNDKNWKNGEADEVETEWEILQEEFNNANGQNNNAAGKNAELPDGDEVVTRRYEFYKYIGPYDTETNEVLCDKFPDPTPECTNIDLIGDYIGAQMAGFNVNVPLGLIDHIQDGTKGQAYPNRSVVVGGNTPYGITVTNGVLPDGLTLDSTTGVLSGTPTALGTFQFIVRATDADNVTVSLAYSVTISAVVVLGDIDRDGDIDLNDINAILAARNQPAAPGDARDYDGDGRITVGDARACTLQCTQPHCAIE
jgi:hypothetical protein